LDFSHPAILKEKKIKEKKRKTRQILLEERMCGTCDHLRI
jgi:hypothetical protein